MLTAGGCGPGCPLVSWPDATFRLSSLCLSTIIFLSASLRPALYGYPHAPAGVDDYDIIL